MTELPRSWASVRLSDLGPWIGGGTPSKANPAYWNGPIPWVSPKDMKTRVLWSTLDGITAEAIERSSAKRVPPKSVLIVTRSGILAHSLPVAVTAVESALNQDLKALNPPCGISPDYIAWGLRACAQRILNTCRKGGTTVHSIEMPRLYAFEIPIAPTNEQHRIVERIESLFDEIHRGLESLREAKRTIGLYRQSLLKSAFDGRLTADWRAGNSDKLESPDALLARIREQRQNSYKAALHDWERALSQWRKGGGKGKRPAKPKVPKRYLPDHSGLHLALPELPHGWAWSHLGCSSTGPEYGTAAKSSSQGEAPVVRMGNIQNGRIDWSDLVYTSDMEEIARYSLQPGDVLFNRTNSPELVGKTAIYRGERPALFAGYLVRVNQIIQIASGPYVAHFLNSPRARKHGKSVKTDGVNQSNINGTKLQEYPFPFCSLAEQAEIVRILDARLEAAETLDAEIDASLVRAESLRQSILNKAFEGQLVPQDPTDEPASALLARIRAERDTEPSKRSRRRAEA